MSRFLIFNHHSLPFASKEVAMSSVVNFLKICNKAKNLGLSTILVDESIDKNWFRLQLSPGYFWNDWYLQFNNDENIDIIRTFRSINTRQPMFSIEDINKGLDLLEVKLNGNDNYPALRAAVWHEAHLASFPTNSNWTISPIQVEVNEIAQDGTLNSKRYNIINIYSMEILSIIEEELKKQMNCQIHSGRMIMTSKKDLYPFIDFCGKAPEQLNNWSNSVTLLEQVKESLASLNIFAEKWKNGELNNYSHINLKSIGLNHRVSGESETVLQNSNLKKEREFYLPNGNKELFENHIKLARGFRVYFFPDVQTKIVYIGYIGSHMRDE